MQSGNNHFFRKILTNFPVFFINLPDRLFFLHFWVTMSGSSWGVLSTSSECGVGTRPSFFFGLLLGSDENWSLDACRSLTKVFTWGVEPLMMSGEGSGWNFWGLPLNSSRYFMSSASDSGSLCVTTPKNFTRSSYPFTQKTACTPTFQLRGIVHHQFVSETQGQTGSPILLLSRGHSIPCSWKFEPCFPGTLLYWMAVYLLEWSCYFHGGSLDIDMIVASCLWNQPFIQRLHISNMKIWFLRVR